MLISDSPLRSKSVEEESMSPMARVLARLDVSGVPADTMAALATSTLPPTSSMADESRTSHNSGSSSGYNTLDSVATTSSISSDEGDATCVITGIPSLSFPTGSYMQTDV